MNISPPTEFVSVDKRRFAEVCATVGAMHRDHFANGTVYSVHRFRNGYETVTVAGYEMTNGSYWLDPEAMRVAA